MAGQAQRRTRANARNVTAPAGAVMPVRQTRAALKRAASEDPTAALGAIAAAPQAKKRRALANLTNQQVNCRNVASKPQVAAAKKIPLSQAALAEAQAEAEAAALFPLKQEGSKQKPESVSISVPLTQEKEEIVQNAQGPSTNKESSLFPQSSDSYTHNDENMPPAQPIYPPATDFPSPEPHKKIRNSKKAHQEVKVVQEVSLETKTLQEVSCFELKFTRNMLVPARGRQTLINQGPSEEETSSLQTYTDIDKGRADPQMCSIYAPEIYENLRMSELKKRQCSDFMGTVQHDINSHMRGILVDWLVEVAEEYKLVPDTLYLTVAYVDRFLSAHVVNRHRLQLLGVSCMLIASKYEEICAPQVEDFCYMTDNTYRREEVLDMERRILKHLKFELSIPTTKTFLRRFIRAAQTSYKTPSLQLEFLGNYLSELTLVEYSFLRHLPSKVAASAVFLARLTLDPESNPWTSTLQHYTGYHPTELQDCVKEIHNLQRNVKKCTLPGVREKYKQHKFKCVASLKPPAVLPPVFFQEEAAGLIKYT